MLDKLVIAVIVIAAVYYLYRRFRNMISPDSPSCGGGCGCSTPSPQNKKEQP